GGGWRVGGGEADRRADGGRAADRGPPDREAGAVPAGARAARGALGPDERGVLGLLGADARGARRRDPGRRAAGLLRGGGDRPLPAAAPAPADRPVSEHLRWPERRGAGRGGPGAVGAGDEPGDPGRRPHRPDPPLPRGGRPTSAARGADPSDPHGRGPGGRGDAGRSGGPPGRGPYQGQVDRRASRSRWETTSTGPADEPLPPEVRRQAVGPRVVGRWSHTVNDRAAEDLRLLSDGRIDSRFAGGRWTVDGTTLTLTWPRQGGAPKVNTVRLSDDRTTYQGKNDRDWVVMGVKIPDQP